MPAQAVVLEQLRRRIYDLHMRWGYHPVHPPFVEYLESLLSSTGKDFDRHTFKVVDPLSGRMMGLRADMTPQVARIDAHTLGGTGVSRLFYMGTVIRAYGDSTDGNRSPLQMGAELFGHSGIESDVEVIKLMLATLECVGMRDVHLDLGHAEIFNCLIDKLQLTGSDHNALFDLLQRKAESDLMQLSSSLGINEVDSKVLCALCSLNGGLSVLESAEKLLAGYGDKMIAAIDALRQTGGMLMRTQPSITVHYDLAEVRGYQYHNGVVFAAYVSQRGSEIARGGRYDGIGETFGSRRAATGYSTDLKTLMSLCKPTQQPAVGSAIIAPFSGSSDESSALLQSKIAELRESGEVVVTALEGELSQGNTATTYNRTLIEKDGRWLLENLK